ncbi:MAG: SDR family NAD(P)-dependent oxidoreductase [Anaerolineaceae bacterium]|nr:SDR family NAD(P)-dependent oxidoreductase [Anaerolineaceae bacterium]MCB9099948.1 SDR family NAD(P)-dependent oxidoreductase [Anaerolineales bacterium]
MWRLKIRRKPEFTYQTIVLTGAASGIGRALLNRWSSRPLRILAVDIDGQPLAATVQALATAPAAITPLVLDLSTPENVDRLFDEAVKALGSIDLFMANAGFAYYEQLDLADWSRLERIFRVNVFSPIYAAVKMKQLNSSRPYKVVMTASAMAYLALPGYAVYAGTKAALHRFAEGYRLELDDPDRLALVYPIATRTHFFAAAGPSIPVPWPAQAADPVARAIISGIEQNRRAIYPSRLLATYLFLERFFPALGAVVQWPDRWKFKRWLRRGGR